MGYENTKRILVVSPLPLSYPPRDGYSLYVIYRSYFLKSLANINSDIIVPERIDKKEYLAKNLIDSGIFDNVFTYPSNSKWKSLIKSFFSPSMIYLMVWYDINNTILKIIIDSVNRNKYQAVIFDHSYSYHLYKKLKEHINISEDKIIYWSHNIDYIEYKIESSESSSLLKKFIFYITSRKLKKIEHNYIRKFSKIVSVSYHEVNTLREINPDAKVCWIPPILPESKSELVDKKFISEVGEKVKDYKYKILFVGILNKPSNVLPCIWFVNYVLPILKNNIDGKVCFLIVGKDPSKEIFNLSKDNKDILVFPNVPSVLPFYELADLVVVPLFNPSGIKLKLIEALKNRKKVVARPEALIGAGLENIIPSAYEPWDFAQKCIQVLNGRINYDVIWDKFDEIYDNKKNINKLLEFIFEN